MKKITGSVTAPKGFLAAGIKSGIKENKLDLGLIFSKVPALAAGVFTRNEVKAAPVEICQSYLKDGRAQAIIVNSGNANCLCGHKGFDQAVNITKHLASLLANRLPFASRDGSFRQAYLPFASIRQIRTEDMLIASTGVIGKPFPADKIIAALPELVSKLSRSGDLAVAKAIMTTDLYLKKIAVSIKIGGCNVKIGGIAKGSGMIYPNMATMLCFLTTDACIEPKALAKALPDAVTESFNAITVDGDMSTNDAVIILANSMAGNPRIKYGTKNYKIFCEALKYVASYLAKEIVKDGEGASKFVEVKVKGARTKSDAQKIATRIANSNLVKTAIAGEDPNVGRIASAAGAAGVKFDVSKLEVCLSGLKIMSRGRIYDQARAQARRLLQNKDIKITVNLNEGNGTATIWTCDLTEGYIKINAKYN